ncbi:hypothetical protein A3F37_01950 [Candidatus Saccharibacteria bacterium RIFCSPHIGHO2_12_FULL_41_12]|nr:MAG: hypothetical protein A3F37_01950 [Candidatus Saccharibacteria bacterium RIFCSPHIGHO2_12_FULL_41_12]
MNKIIDPGESPAEIRKYYDEITKAYQIAFAGPPWFEVSKCTDDLRRCEGGFSALDVGDFCTKCQQCTQEPAYLEADLVSKFDEISATRPSRWYLEFCEENVALASLAWRAGSEQIADEKYDNKPEIKAWLANQLPRDRDVIWLDEVFANKSIRPDRNLNNFTAMISLFMRELNLPLLAYRTINPQMVSGAERFGSNARIFAREKDVPDRRDFVIITNGRQS